jgi:hypothetical protein
LRPRLERGCIVFWVLGPKGEVKEDQIQDAMEIVESLNKKVKPEERKMKLETANLSLVSATR